MKRIGLTMLILSFLLLQATVVSVGNLSSPEALLPDHYLYYNVSVYDGQSIQVGLKASAPVELMIMDKQQFEEFSQGRSYSSLYSVITSNLSKTFSAPRGGVYYVVVYNGMSGVAVQISLTVRVVPTLPTTYFSSLPAPVGIGYFGVENDSGRIHGTVLEYREAIGYATVYSILAYNASPPKGVSEYGASLQMNAVLFVDTVHGTYAYWLQNVVVFITNESVFYITDNVWNYTGSISTFASNSVTGHGKLHTSVFHGLFYAYTGARGSYSLPFSVVLYTRLDSVSPNNVTVSFGYNLGRGTVWYDNVTIRQDGIASAVLLVDPFTTTPGGHPYDLDLVFGGQSCGEWTYFERMNASLALEVVLFNGTSVLPNPLYTFGVTGERADNLETVELNGRAFVTVGDNVFWKQVTVSRLPELYFNGETGWRPNLSAFLSAVKEYPGVFLIVFFLLFVALYRAFRRRS